MIDFEIQINILCFVPKSIVDKSVLHQGGKDEADTDPLPYINGLGVGHWRQGRVDGGRLGGHGQEGGHAQRHPRGHGLGVQPEVDPGDDDEHAAGHVDGDEVVGELPLEDQVHRETAVLPSVGLDVAVAAGVLLYVEPGQVEALGQLDRVRVVPLVGDVVRGVAVAGDLEGAGLSVHGVELEVHGAGESQGDPDTVEHVAVGEDPDVDVVDEDVVEVTSLLVAEEGVRHPHLLRVSQR